jgi:hypothetical protein
VIGKSSAGFCQIAKLAIEFPSKSVSSLLRKNKALFALDVTF